MSSSARGKRAIDTTTPSGRLTFHLSGGLGQFERDLVRERIGAGLLAAAAPGPERRALDGRHVREGRVERGR